MKSGVVTALSFVAIAMGGLFLVSTLSNPSLDVFILARDLGLSLSALATGVAAPLLHRKFTSDEEGRQANN
ncbi:MULTISPECIES: hypothetical protein [unclassified Pyrobaculum]|jgi:hypothetical protein|uniref:hypothetical protein n=1 Tax=unclassified Pyrobaculum TaxID=2643434 RepID=UPI0021DB5DEB|nr:hypothetical protein [Pyrobaculum sp. 3827-6]MCU7788513.1 hypothetical protein [Pyrobaculum sp. 3827-6]